MNTLAAIAAIVVVLGALHVAASVVVPFLVAGCVVIAFQPVARRVSSRGWPAAVTSLVTVGAVVVVLGLLAVLAIAVLGQVIDSVPHYRAELEEARHKTLIWLNERKLEGPAMQLAKVDVEAWAARAITGSLSLMGGVLATLLIVLLLTVFIQLEAPSFPIRLRRAFGVSDRAAEAERTLGALGDIQRYLLIKIATSTAKATAVGLFTWALGLDYPALWAGLIFLLNFVPVLGSLAAAVPPVAAAALTLGTPAAVLTGVGLLLINVALGGVIEPRVLGRAVGLSPLVVVLALALWGFVLGPVGALLAVPLTMVLKLVLEHHPDLDWAARLLQHRDVPEPTPELTPEPTPAPTLA